MLIPVTVFWISLSLLFFCYIGYGMLLFLFNKLKAVFSAENKKASPNGAEEIPVSIIISAYNEKKVLEKKIRNTLDIDYPRDKLTIFLVTDGSTDGSELVVRQYPSLHGLHEPERKGKLAAIKRAMQQVQTPIVVFSDANTELNKACIRKIVSHYHNPATGGVAGEKKITRNPAASGVGEAEGLYWKYESFMKMQDANFHTVVGAAGELFSIRTALFPQLDNHIILDDFVISMKICLKGYKIQYEPQAFATEFPSASLAEEEKRKVRISAGVYQCIGYLKNALNVYRHPLLGFQYISRRLLRWVVCPVMLVALLLSNLVILFTGDAAVFYTVFLYGQLAFYLAACIGWLFTLSGKSPGILTIPFYFVFMNYCLVKGFIKFLKGKQSVLWDKSVRQE
jgi:poly-beta-1,6-N-acetyl-D-glucosamine synthase